MSKRMLSISSKQKDRKFFFLNTNVLLRGDAYGGLRLRTYCGFARHCAIAPLIFLSF
ncbi:hypothetical protein [Calothrix sp. NIES-2100]|uniref:hypothetical protein n=1 Tax=Calothrix sp. NIES-2100 TaxID=1954172 RepID=UPI0030DD9D58